MILKTETIRGEGGDNLVVTFQSGYYGWSSGGFNFIVGDKKSHEQLAAAMHSHATMPQMRDSYAFALGHSQHYQRISEAYGAALMRIASGVVDPETEARAILKAATS